MNNNSKAMTLVELIIVIVIIGIISSVAVPRLFKSTNKAYEAMVQSLAADIKSSLKMVRAKHYMNPKKKSMIIDNRYYALNSSGYPLMGRGDPSRSGNCEHFLRSVIGQSSSDWKSRINGDGCTFDYLLDKNTANYVQYSPHNMTPVCYNDQCGSNGSAQISDNPFSNNNNQVDETGGMNYNEPFN